MGKRLFDALILLGAMLYILLGVSITPVHGDEYTQIFMAHDSYYMAQGNWDKLPYTALGPMNDLLYLRLINGTVNKTLIGFVWLLEGRPAYDLPGLYDWMKPVSINRAFGNVPTIDDIVLSRWPSAAFTALAVIPLFLLMRQLPSSRPIAYVAVVLYALHPVILVNGRRAVMEGSLIFGSLATICWLVIMTRAAQQARSQGFLKHIPVWLRYVVLGLLAGFTVATKFSGIFVAAAVIVAIIADGLRHNDARRLMLFLGITVASMAVMWLVLNPAYWNDPVGAVGVMLRERDYLLANQTHSSPLRYSTLWQRLDAALVQPYVAPPQFSELSSWTYMIADQVEAYQASPLAGWNPGVVGNVLLTLLAVFGLGGLAYQALDMQPVAWAMLAWTGLTLLETLTIPLGWQRYYLPLMLVSIVLTAVGTERLWLAIRTWQTSRVAIKREEPQIQETFDSPAA